ncbi:hypothetical protein [Hahella ganghwensis]|uniref:hypothetical protein n=1 Tax=Hahella ganghwensis TaxID=286420 RepID=UPI00036A40B6|nr:hypothetical protein [Hahella ganghwensis]
MTAYLVTLPDSQQYYVADPDLAFRKLSAFYDVDADDVIPSLRNGNHISFDTPQGSCHVTVFEGAFALLGGEVIARARDSRAFGIASCILCDVWFNGKLYFVDDDPIGGVGCGYDSLSSLEEQWILT